MSDTDYDAVLRSALDADPRLNRLLAERKGLDERIADLTAGFYSKSDALKFRRRELARLIRQQEEAVAVSLVRRLRKKYRISPQDHDSKTEEKRPRLLRAGEEPLPWSVLHLNPSDQPGIRAADGGAGPS